MKLDCHKDSLLQTLHAIPGLPQGEILSSSRTGTPESTRATSYSEYESLTCDSLGPKIPGQSQHGLS